MANPYTRALAKPAEQRSKSERRVIEQHNAFLERHGKQAVPEPTTCVKEYNDLAQMGRDVAQMARAGWVVTAQSSYTPKKGLGRTLLGGLLFLNPKPRTVVTYAQVAPEEFSR